MGSPIKEFCIYCLNEYWTVLIDGVPGKCPRCNRGEDEDEEDDWRLQQI